MIDADSLREIARPVPILVTSRPSVSLSDRCGTLGNGEFDMDRDFLFIDNFYNSQDPCGEGIISFFVRKSVYFAFFGDIS